MKPALLPSRAEPVWWIVADRRLSADGEIMRLHRARPGLSVDALRQIDGPGRCDPAGGVLTLTGAPGELPWLRLREAISGAALTHFLDTMGARVQVERGNRLQPALDAARAAAREGVTA